MSHFTIYKTKIGNVTFSSLKSAVESLARQISAVVCQEVEDYYGNKQKVAIGLRTKQLPMGIGFNISKEGMLQVQGDSFGVEEEFQKLQMLTTNYVKAYKCAIKAASMSSFARVQTKIEGQNVILEVAF